MRPDYLVRLASDFNRPSPGISGDDYLCTILTLIVVRRDVLVRGGCRGSGRNCFCSRRTILGCSTHWDGLQRLVLQEGGAVGVLPRILNTPENGISYSIFRHDSRHQQKLWALFVHYFGILHARWPSAPYSRTEQRQGQRRRYFSTHSRLSFDSHIL